MPIPRRLPVLLGLLGVVAACAGAAGTGPESAPGAVELTPEALAAPTAPSRPAATDPPTVATTGAVATTRAAPPATSPPSSRPIPATAAAPTSTEAATTTEPAPPITFETRADAGRSTGCYAVMHIGDSTSVGMIATGLLTDPAVRLDAQYRRVGVVDVRIDAANGRSVKEYSSEATPATVAAQVARATGFTGCWVFALGTNDAASIARGSATGARERIDRMMAIAAGEPVLWVNPYTLKTDGFYADVNMLAFGEALRAAEARYPNLRVYDWRSIARPEWFLSDGIHYNALGYRERARRIADALASAFPEIA